MLCDECGSGEATIRLTTIVNGERQERMLCASCMAKMKSKFPAVDLSSLAGLLTGILQAAKPPKPEAPELDLTCDACHTTYEQFKKTGFLGCPRCYDAFREPIAEMLTRVHGHTQHTGRVPGGQSGDLSLRLRLEQLKQKLGCAIAEEAYEDAAILRDEIHALKAQLDAGKQEDTAHE